MIVSPGHGFAFLHIPKCAGTSIRRQIEPFDGYDGLFSGAAGHGRFSHIEMTHLPARTVAEHFPGVYRALLELDVYALTREPHARFRSAVAQHLRNFHGRRLADTPPDELAAVLDGVMETLAATDAGAPLPQDCIHFTRQADYVFCGNRRIVTHLYRLEDLPAFCDSLSCRAGIRIDPGERSNQTLSLRLRGLEGTVWKVNDFLIGSLPPRLYRRLKLIATPLLARRTLDSDRSDRTDLLDSPGIRQFVETYYAADFDLYRDANGGRARGT